MTTRTNIASKSNGGKIQPFEWLTSPESIGGFVREHVLLLGKDAKDFVDRNGNDNQNNNAGDASVDTDRHPPPSNYSPPSRSLKAMHIGCGSSTVGEYLVQELGFETVANVDCDRETLQGMEERWKEMNNSRKSQTEQEAVTAEEEEYRIPTIVTQSQSSRSSSSGNMEFWCLDYTRERLPDCYANMFDLVVDKSTLDCTLCSDCASTASFLMEIYRTLKANVNDDDGANGGVYLVISFHELDLILPLVKDLPGAHWTVTHSTMERQVECVVNNARGYSGSNGSSSNNRTILRNDENYEETAANTTSGGGRKPLNVLIARRLPNREESSPELEFDDVVRHVQEVNDRWFQEEQPLLTEERVRDLRRAFTSCEEHGEKKVDTALALETTTATTPIPIRSKLLSLEEAYEVIFTQAEREHLTFEHFLEDWEAFREGGIQGRCDLQNSDGNNHNHQQGMDYDLAIRFLELNQ